MRCHPVTVSAAVFAALAVAIAAPPAPAQDQPSPEVLLEDFIYYVRTANLPLAEGNAQALLDSGITPEQFVNLIDDSPTLAQDFDEAYRQALVTPQLEPLAARLGGLYEGGRRARARNPQEIEKNVKLLGGTARQQLFARDRLKEAGEYAMPDLVGVIALGRDLFLRAQARDVIIDLGRDAVAPLIAALEGAAPETQEQIVEMLGRIGYEASLPALYDLHERTPNTPVRLATEQAIAEIRGAFDPNLRATDLYADLAEQFFNERRLLEGGLTSFPRESHQLLWSFRPAGGDLLPTAVRTEVYHEVRAMQFAKRALELDVSNDKALAVYLASNFGRVLDSPAGYADPIFGDDPRDPTFYAVAAGSGRAQRALEFALEQRDTVLARRIIAALGRSVGGVGLWAGVEDAKPLVAALAYPDRRVQYEAAMVLGASNPKQRFEGADRVVPILSGAVRDASAQYALVITADLPRGQSIREALEADGFTVLPPERSLNAAQGSLATAPGVDLIVLDQDARSTIETITSARRRPKLEAAPILAFMSLKDQQGRGAVLRDDPLSRAARPGVSDSELVASANDLLEKATGPRIGADEASLYAQRALDVLREIAGSGTDVFQLEDAATSLINNLEGAEGELQSRVGEVVAWICQPRAQVALIDAALDASGDQQVALLGHVVSSAHRCGSRIEARQVERLRRLVASEDVAAATAAAAAMGALNLPSDQVAPLVIRDR